MSTVAIPLPWQVTSQGVILRVHVQPRASRTRLVGQHGGSLKVALTAPPVENAANTALLVFLATLLQAPRTALTLVAGAKSREKQIQITTPHPSAVIQRLEALLAAVDKKISDG